MSYYAVLDTNVVVSALLSKNPSSPPVLLLEAVINGDIIPLYHEDIIQEYNEVLRRKKFNFLEDSLNKEQAYLIQNHHPAIISKAIFDKVQQELSRRSNVVIDEDGVRRAKKRYSSRSS